MEDWDEMFGFMCKEDNLGYRRYSFIERRRMKRSMRKKRDYEVYTFEDPQFLTEQNPNSLALDSKCFTIRTPCPFPVVFSLFPPFSPSLSTYTTCQLLGHPDSPQTYTYGLQYASPSSLSVRVQIILNDRF